MASTEGGQQGVVVGNDAWAGVLKRDRAVIVGGLLVIVVLAWAYTLRVSLGQSGMAIGDGMAMPDLSSWTAADWAAMFAMWAVMMVAMMLPTAAPMILVFAAVNRRRWEQGRPYVSTGVFTLGYLVAWAAFAAVATTGNWALHTHALLSSMMGETSTAVLGGALLIAAGAFQWTPLKYACLNHCRSPIGFLMTEWRDGVGGALRMGLKHGAYCVGCCWVLMALLFVLGIMNLVWIAALAGFVLLEKVVPQGRTISRASGVGLIAWGTLMLLGIIGS